jgi:hypothetical protein
MNIGDVFTLKPGARIKWLVFGKYSLGPLIAVRCDSEVGRGLMKWIADGKPANKPYTWREVTLAAREFYEHDLTQAEVIQ